MNELVNGLSQNDVVTYPHAFLSGCTQVLDLPQRVYGVYLRITLTTPLVYISVVYGLRYGWGL